MQRMPAQPKVELTMPRADLSREASLKTRPWFLACVCAWTRLPCAAMEKTCLPTGVVPTKLTPRTAGCFSRTSASSFSAVMRFTTPLGRPASYRMSSNLPPVMGTRLDALSTRVLPVAMHRGSIQPKGIMAGKLKGAIPANTPSCLLYTSDAADDLLCVDLGG